MPGMKVKCQNILRAFLVNAANTNESIKSRHLYPEILKFLKGVLRNNFVFRGKRACANHAKIFPER